VKKLISIGVALALLTMAVVPVAVAAEDYTPDTFAKVPFGIIASGIDLVGKVIEAVPMIKDQLPAGLDITAVTNLVAPWTAGPLSWTVDMMAWGVDLMSKVMGPVLTEFAPDFAWATDIFDTIACGLTTCFSSNCTGEFCPCVGLNITPCS